VALRDIGDYGERTFRPLAEQKDLGLDVEIAEDAPDTIVTDEVRLQQVLKNLLSNAVKFTEQGGVMMRIERASDDVQFATPELATAEGVLAFSVVDTGIGIPDDKLHVIFEAFQQADGTTSRRYGGTGLGLSISREIAQLLGGEIRVRSQPGRGSTFTLYLPVVFHDRESASELEERLERLVDEGRELIRETVASLDLDPAVLLPGDVADDRTDVQDGDRVVLVAEEDEEMARMMLDAARARGFKGVVARRGDAAIALAHELQPAAIVLDTSLPSLDGWTVLDRLKRDSATRHIPVHVVSSGDNGKTSALRAGAVAVVEKPLLAERLAETFDRMARFVDRRVKRLLVVEDDAGQRASIVGLVASDDDVEAVAVGTSAEARQALGAEEFDCVVLDLRLPDSSGFELLERIRTEERLSTLPVIVYTGAELTPEEETQLRRYAEAIVLKDARSPERLLDETALFLHRVEARLPQQKRRVLERAHSAEAVFQGKKVLIVDDDVRNVFALTSALEANGMDVIFAENGRDGVDALQASPDVDLVLMDVMMPELDGYEATRTIRQMPEFEKLPIISLTAKAMKGDRERSIDAGASDYITKPVDVDRLLSLMRVWLYR
ncbi:MAG: response regulator, partial [Gaiellaceae bacterium]